MSWYTLKWIHLGGAKLAEKRVNGKPAVRAQIIKWVDEDFGDHGDQIHVTQEETEAEARKRRMAKGGHC